MGSNGIIADQRLSASYLMIADFPPPQDFFDKLNECIHKTSTRLAVLRLLACMLNLQVQTYGARDPINKISWETVLFTRKRQGYKKFRIRQL